MKAVHFGAGNIGRGFIGLLLSRAGYEVVFADVNAELIAALAQAREYRVHEVGAAAQTELVTGVRAIDSAQQTAQLIEELASAEIATTAVGPSILKFIAPHLVAALRARTGESPLAIMACENAVNATDILREQMRALVETEEEWAELSARAIFANTAVDRIVPAQSPDAGLDVTVEAFCEWTIERGPFGENVPNIPGAHFVDDLAPFIERKLFTVNTGHAATAYFGFEVGVDAISEAIRQPSILKMVSRALRETSELLVVKHGFSVQQQTAYRETILQRFANRALPDTTVRVGRSPLRKLSRHERFIGPAAECAERGLPYEGLLVAVRAALRFDVPADEESVRMRALLSGMTAAEFTAAVCGLSPEDAIWEPLVRVVEHAKLNS